MMIWANPSQLSMNNMLEQANKHSLVRILLYEHPDLGLTVNVLQQGSYRQVCVKFKDFSRTSKRLSYCFQGLKTYEKY